MISAFDSNQIDKFLHYLFSQSNLLPRVGLTRPALRDSKDDIIPQVAIECDAAIVAHNIGDFDRAIAYRVAVMTQRIAWQIEELAVKISIEIPDDIYQEAEVAALHGGRSVEELFGSIADSHLRSWKALNARQRRGVSRSFAEIMRNVPDVEPEEYDRIQAAQGVRCVTRTPH